MADEKKASVEKVSKDVPDSPSGKALAEVGEPKANASDEELNAHAERYAAEKRKHRWG